MSQIDHEPTSEKIVPRINLIVWLKRSNNQYKLRRYGDIVYFSKKARYCVLYVDEDKSEEIRETLLRLDFVENVVISDRKKLQFSSEHQEKMMAELKEKYDHMREENEDMRV